MNERGWVRLHRQLAEHELWLRDRFSRGQAWVDLLMSANYVERHVAPHDVTVKRGQILTSQGALATRWQWNRETVRLFLRELEAGGMLEIRAVRGVAPAVARASAITSAISKSGGSAIGYTLLTISNYERYQGLQDDASAITSAIRPPATPAIPKKITTRNQERDARVPRAAFSSSSTNGASRKHVDAEWGRA